MVTISIELFEGRSWQQKQDVAARVTDAVVECLSVDRELVRVKFYDLRRSDSAQGGVLGPE